ncbi:Hypothetical protein POVN_LOCUS431 [uncultured virus]|nr:Hypothetical protein POVN_LOCUS431 [uncultured virus]
MYKMDNGQSRYFFYNDVVYDRNGVELSGWDQECSEGRCNYYGDVRNPQPYLTIWGPGMQHPITYGPLRADEIEINPLQGEARCIAFSVAYINNPGSLTGHSAPGDTAWPMEFRRRDGTVVTAPLLGTNEQTSATASTVDDKVEDGSWWTWFVLIIIILLVVIFIAWLASQGRGYVPGQAGAQKVQFSGVDTVYTYAS